MDLLLLGKAPIHPETPTGSDVRYDPDFEALQAEIDKLSLPSSSDVVDWKKVSESAARILSEKSKDLMVASYLGVGQIHLNRIEGFAVGATVLRDLLENYWETLFPPKKRMRGRVGAINFWIEKAEALLEGVNETADVETLDTINKTLADLEALLNEYLPDPPLLHAIKRHINNLIEQGGKTSPSATETEAKGDTRSDSNSKAAAESVEQINPPPEPKQPARSQLDASTLPSEEPDKMESGQDAVKNANAGFQQIRSAGAFIFEKDPKNPDAYRYRRMAAWAKVSSLPPGNGGKTQIPPPSAQEITSLRDLKNNANWHVLLQTTEQKLSRFIYWFDLCRFSAEALFNLGPDYQRAHKAVCDETAFFVHRVPGVDDLAFSDGTAFADSETRQWLKNISLGNPADAAGQISLLAVDASAQENEGMDKILEEAKSLVKQQKTMKAVELIQKHLQSSSSEKGVLYWRSALCQILLGSEFKTLAVPHLEQIVADIDNYRLEKWEPSIALKGLSLAWTGFRSLADSQSNDRADELLNRISRLDPAEALRLSR